MRDIIIFIYKISVDNIVPALVSFSSPLPHSAFSYNAQVAVGLNVRAWDLGTEALWAHHDLNHCWDGTIQPTKRLVLTSLLIFVSKYNRWILQHLTHVLRNQNILSFRRILSSEAAVFSFCMTLLGSLKSIPSSFAPESHLSMAQQNCLYLVKNWVLLAHYSPHSVDFSWILNSNLRAFELASLISCYLISAQSRLPQSTTACSNSPLCTPTQ